MCLSEQEDIDFDSVPSEWRLWFRYFRDDPPTEEELLEVGTIDLDPEALSKNSFQR